jgi:hypothetical protein
MTRAIRLVTLALLSVAATMLAASPALCAQKAALVIGNGAYRSVTPLINPPNDASDMAASLGHIGYAVTLVKDGDLQAMNDGLRAFLRDADHADSVVVFYSGHGVQVKGHNYLIPVSARIADELDLDTQAISLDKLLDLVDGAAPKVKIVILDSCRDNPLTRTLVRGAGTRGLARIDLDAASAKGTLIAFSTAPGSVAQDGTGRNSPFTQALLAHMETPGLDIRQMFGQVRADVDRQTQGGQTPWVNEAIIGSFAMAGTVADPQPVKTIQVVPQAQAEPQPQPEPAQPPEPQQQASLDPEPVPLPDAQTQPRRNNQAEFILPDSGSRRLNWDDVSSLSGAQLRVARNEIYARRGRYMKDVQLRAYFSQFSWYRPYTWDVTLNPVEKANVALIQRAEAGQ